MTEENSFVSLRLQWQSEKLCTYMRRVRFDGGSAKSEVRVTAVEDDPADTWAVAWLPEASAPDSSAESSGSSVR